MPTVTLRDAYNHSYTVELEDGGTIPLRDAFNHMIYGPDTAGTIPLRDAFNHLFYIDTTDGNVVPLYDGNHHLFFTVVDSAGTQVVLRDAWNHQFTVGIRAGGTIPLRDCYQNLFYASSDLTTFSPLDIAGLELWLDGSDASTMYDATSGGSLVADGGAVARWEDKSGNANHATQPTANSRPLRNAGGFLEADGVDDSLAVAALTLPAFITVFVVAATVIANTAKFWMEHGVNAGSSDGFFFNGIDNNAWVVNRSGFHSGYAGGADDWIGDALAVAAFKYDGTGRIYKNGVLLYDTTQVGGARPDADYTATLYLFSREGNGIYAACNMREVLIYDSPLSDADRESVETYLLNKWGITP